MKIFLTGSSGFIGKNLHRKLCTDHDVYAMRNDLLDFDLVYKELGQFNPDIVIHLAARTEVEKSFTEQNTFSEVNYVGSVNLIEAANTLPNLKMFLFASTMEVYGWQPISDHILQAGYSTHHEIFDEHTQPNPNAPYAVAKFGVEKYLQYIGRTQGFPYSILRQTNCYGRDDNDFFVTEQIISQMLKNPDEIRLGDPLPYRNFIYIDDLIAAWTSLIEHIDLIAGRIFTVGPDNPVQISVWADMIASKLKWTGHINWSTKPKRPGEIYWLNSSNQLLTDTVGWNPKIDYDIGLSKIIDLWKENIHAGNR